MFKARDFYTVAQLGQENVEYHYRTTDKIADVLGEGYFNSLNVAHRNTTVSSYQLNMVVGDWIRLNAGDGFTILVVTASDDARVVVSEVFARKSAGRLALSKE